jgi:hypothetical protein
MRIQEMKAGFILHEGQYYIASLTPGLDGIQIAKLRWVAKSP